MATCVTGCYRLTLWFTDCNTSYLMKLELVFKIEFVCSIPKGMGWNRTLLSLNFATEADTMRDIVCEVDLNKDRSEYNIQ